MCQSRYRKNLLVPWHAFAKTVHAAVCCPSLQLMSKRVEDRRYEKLNATLKNSTTQLNDLLQRAGAGELSFTYQPEQWPRQDVLDGFLGKAR